MVWSVTKPAKSAGSADSQGIQGGAEDNQKYMSQYAGDYQKYMQGSTGASCASGSAGSEGATGGCWRRLKYMSQFADDYHMYVVWQQAGDYLKYRSGPSGA